MEKTAEVFFEHFGISPGRSAADIYRIGEVFSEIPWENLTKFLIRSSGEIRPRLAEEVITGFVNSGTGGTCYSLTETLGSILRACGLSARPLTGHMKHGNNIHCALLVEGEAGKFVLDPGYIVPGAVKLSDSGAGEIETSGRKMTWTPVDGGWELTTVENGRKQLRYRLESRVLSRKEFIGYWKNSFSSSGLNSLYLNRTAPSGGRIIAHNGNLRTIDSMGKRNSKLRQNYSGKISEFFGISPVIAEAAWTELQRLQKLKN
jgi:arylamine N-acetyltransferase